jgi:hypothetical protein
LDPFLAIVVDPIKSANLSNFFHWLRKGGFRSVQSLSKGTQRREPCKYHWCSSPKSSRFRSSLSTILPTSHSASDKQNRRINLKECLEDVMGLWVSSVFFFPAKVLFNRISERLKDGLRVIFVSEIISDF